MTNCPSFAGIDVGARRLHAVLLDGTGTVAGVETLDATDPAAVVAWLPAGTSVAIDSPDGWSTLPHASRAEPAVSRKFRAARCGEIALGVDHGVWVPWVSPPEAKAEDAPAWMEAGVRLFATLRAAGYDAVEVYPYAAFRVLNGGQPLAAKRTAAGRAQRLRLLRDAGVEGVDQLAPGLGHDLVDAAVAALVARHRRLRWAMAATCGHDGSAIWLPAAPPAVSAAATPRRRRPDQRPVWPNPPCPRTEAESASTTTKAACSTSTMTSWAIRSPRWIS